MAGDYSAGTAHVSIVPKMDNFGTKLRAELARHRAELDVEVGANTAKFSAAVQAAIAAAQTQRVTIHVGAETLTATQQIDAAARNRGTTIHVDADAHNADTTINRLVSRADKSDIAVTVDADIRDAEKKIGTISQDRTPVIRPEVDTEPAKRKIADLFSSFKKLDRYQRRVAMVATGYTLLGTAIAGAVGPAVALTAALSGVMSTLVTLPAILGSVVAGIAGLGVGFSGIGSALGAIGKGGGGGGGRGTDPEAQARAITRAQRGVRDAERNLAKAQEESAKSQERLTKARKEAARELDELNDKVEDAQLAEEGAAQALVRARQKLIEVQSNPQASRMDIAEADLAYRRAEAAMRDSADAHVELSEAAADANARGIEGSEQVVEAHEKNEEAAWAAMKAAEALEEAHWSLEEAMKSLEEAGGGGADPFAEAMANLAPSAQAFVHALIALGDAWTDVRLATQEALFTGMGESITNLADRQLPVLKDGLVGINTEINRGLRTSMAEFSTELAATDFDIFLRNTTGLFDGLASAARPMSRLWIDLATVGSEYLPAMGRGIEDVTAKWAAQIQVARATGDLNQIIDSGIQAWARSLRALSDIGGVVSGTLGAASAAGNPFMTAMGEQMSSTNQWVNSFDGQNALVDFFTRASAALGSAMPVFRALGGIIADVLLPAVESTVTGVAPGLTNFIDSVRDTATDALPFIDTFATTAGNVLSGFGDLIVGLQPLLGIVFDIGEAFMSIPGPAATALAALAIGKWLKVPDMFTRAKTGVSGLYDEIVTLNDLEWRRDNTPSMLESSLKVLGQNHPWIGRMGDAFNKYGSNLRTSGVDTMYAASQMEGLAVHTNTAKGMLKNFAGTATGVGAAALSGMKTGLDGIVGLLGGPWGVAFTVATTVFTAMSEEARKVERTAEILDELAQSATDAGAALFNALVDNDLGAGVDAIEAHIDRLIEKNRELAEMKPGVMGTIGAAARGYVADMNPFDGGRTNADVADEFRHRSEVAEKAGAMDQALTDAGITAREVAEAIGGSAEHYDRLIGRLDLTTEGGKAAAEAFGEQRTAALDAEAVIAQMEPSAARAEGAFRNLAASTGDAATKADLARIAFMELQGINMSAKEAAGRLTEEITRLGDQIERSKTGVNEFAQATLDSNGALDTTTDAGWALHQTLDRIASSYGRTVAAGEDAETEFARLAPALDELRNQTTLTEQEWDNLLEMMGLSPDMAEFNAAVGQMTEAQQKVAGLVTAFKDWNGEPIAPKDLILHDEAAQQKLRDMGFQLEELDVKGTFKVIANDQQAVARLNWWVESGFPEVDMRELTAKINLDDSGLMLKVDAAKMQLATLDKTRPIPVADLDIKKLTDKQIEALEKGNVLANGKFVPSADMNIHDLTEKQQIAISQVWDLAGEKPTPHADLMTKEFDGKRDGVHKDIGTLNEARAEVKIDADASGLEEELNWVEKMLNWVSDKWDSLLNKDKPNLAPEPGTRPSASRASDWSMPHYATGGRLPTTGPGTDRVDGFLGVDHRGMPIARVDAGEWVINRDMSERYSNELAQINAGTFPKYASGGIIQSGVQSVTPHQQEMWDIIRTQFPDAQLSSAKRDWGTNDFHDLGKAIDMGGGWSNDLQAIANWIGANYPHSTELFWDPGPNIKNGKPTGAIGGHSDHVHWAMNQPVGPPSPQELPKLPDWGHDFFVHEISRAAKTAGVGVDGAVIGVATALVESGNPLLMYANHAVPDSLKYRHDAIGSDHDSVGLFQQRNNGAWGTLAQRMDPYESAGLFFRAMLSKFPNWKEMEPGAVAQGVQVSQFPDRYATQMANAANMLTKLGGYRIDPSFFGMTSLSLGSLGGYGDSTQPGQPGIVKSRGGTDSGSVNFGTASDLNRLAKMKFRLHDTGGVYPNNSISANLSGANELVLTNWQWGELSKIATALPPAAQALLQAARALPAALPTGGNNNQGWNTSGVPDIFGGFFDNTQIVVDAEKGLKEIREIQAEETQWLRTKELELADARIQLEQATNPEEAEAAALRVADAEDAIEKARKEHEDTLKNLAAAERTVMGARMDAASQATTSVLGAFQAVTNSAAMFFARMREMSAEITATEDALRSLRVEQADLRIRQLKALAGMYQAEKGLAKARTDGSKVAMQVGDTSVAALGDALEVFRETGVFSVQTVYEAMDSAAASTRQNAEADAEAIRAAHIDTKIAALEVAKANLLNVEATRLQVALEEKLLEQRKVMYGLEEDELGRLQGASEGAGGFFGGFIKIAKAVFGGVKGFELTGSPVGALIGALPFIGEAIQGIFDIIGGIVDFFKNIGGAIDAFMKADWRGKFDTILQFLGSIIPGIMGAIAAAFTGDVSHLDMGHKQMVDTGEYLADKINDRQAKELAEIDKKFENTKAEIESEFQPQIDNINTEIQILEVEKSVPLDVWEAEEFQNLVATIREGSVKDETSRMVTLLEANERQQETIANAAAQTAENTGVKQVVPVTVYGNYVDFDALQDGFNDLGQQFKHLEFQVQQQSVATGTQRTGAVR